MTDYICHVPIPYWHTLALRPSSFHIIGWLFIFCSYPLRSLSQPPGHVQHGAHKGTAPQLPTWTWLVASCCAPLNSFKVLTLLPLCHGYAEPLQRVCVLIEALTEPAAQNLVESSKGSRRICRATCLVLAPYRWDHDRLRHL